MKALKSHNYGGVWGAMAARQALSLSLAAGLILFPGCKPRGHVEVTAEQNGSVSPEVAATLSQLTRELRRTMMQRKLSGSFEEFAAARSDLTIPPPPAGKKHAIDKKWKVIVVNR
jgi:hypothetical protein